MNESDHPQASTDVAIQPSDELQALMHVIADPATDIAKMQALLEMHERIRADQRRCAFADALARLQGRCPQIAKNGAIIVKGVERSRFAKLEDIDVAIRPLLAEEGFSFSLNERDVPESKMRLYTGTLLHREGHSETREILLPIDQSDFRSVVQSIGSTQSFARRYLIKDFLNIVEKGEDTDGVSLERITTAQVQDLETMLTDLGPGNVASFCKYMNIGKLADMLVRDWGRALSAIDVKRQAQQK